MKLRDRATDGWRRVVPGRPRIDRTAFYPSHSDVPASLPRHELALIGGTPEQPKWASFECPCGTGHRIAVPLARSRGPSWAIMGAGGRRPSLRSSIDSADERRCHFWLREGRVRWAPNRKQGRRATPAT